MSFAGCDEDLNPWLSKLLGYDVAKEGEVRRVLVDIPFDHCVTIYVERYAEKSILAEPIPQALMSAKFIDKENDNGQEGICEAVQQDAGSEGQEEKGD